jgi:RHH-type transcriptional regulator, proline utilization regulon repressor / proline dehydrogenase / delta 1-pyrroline-5-carboxylate dehydrogenase
MEVTTPLAGGRELEVQRVGRQLFAALADQHASIFHTDYWQGQVLQWAMRDEAFKVQLFRFVDVFPALRDPDAVARHLQEYFDHPSGELPAALRWGLKAAAPGHLSTRVVAKAVDYNIHAMAQRFIAGRDAAAALPVLRRLRPDGMTFTLDVLGEASHSRTESEAYQLRYLELLEHLPPEAATWPADAHLDTGPWGPLPRVNVSLKISSLYSQIDPMDFAGSRAALLDALRPLFRAAVAQGAFLNLDLEQFRYRDLTFTVFKKLLLEEEFRTYPDFGIVVQAYLRDAEDDLNGLVEFAQRRGAPVTVRLVKGAYWDYETVNAQQEHWPIPVFTNKADTDAQYERLVDAMMAHPTAIRPAIGSHNIRSIAYAIAATRAAGLADSTLEVQMLHGMAEPIKHAVIGLGLRVREYVPVGEVVPGMAYLVRRLLENTANESFLRQTFVEKTEQDRLLAPPLPTPDLRTPPIPRIEFHPTDPARPGVFVNEPHADFSRSLNRDEMMAALERVRREVGAHHPLLIDGREVETTGTITSINPARPHEILGTVASATAADAEHAVAAAVRAFPAWRDTAPAARAAILFRAADLMRRRRFALSALEVLEAGKPWREADGDVGEAIDFLEYYGREMHRLATPRRLHDVPGEIDLYFYEPRGVAAVIAPWNFPLAILAGMTSAALVAGNTVVMKPANPTPLIAWELARILREAGLPDGVLAYLPGPGAEIGAALAAHPDVDMIAFTGSRDVGTFIMAEAAQVRPGQRSLKRVVAELGGKNAIIVDDDVDLDGVVEGVLTSAFSYAGQKCSACSRAIVLDGRYEEFVARIVGAAGSLRVGDPADPSTRMGPVINQDAFDKIRGYITRGERDATPALAASAPDSGYFIGPHVFVDVPPDAVIAQEEIFGPVLSVLRARDFDHALQIALGTSYGLTGGLYSRSPEHIRRAHREFRVGNLYINRGVTGAMVGRQPFGGSRMSGVGSKAGGPDYLTQFMEPRTVTENTLRRGFAPPEWFDLET